MKGNKIPIKKLVQRKDGSSFVQIFYVSTEEFKEHKSKTSKTSKELHTDSNGNYTPERLKLHDKIVNNLVDSCPTPNVGNKPTAILLLGGAAFGKSTIVNKFIKPQYGTSLGIINVDDVKESIEEYKSYVSEDVLTAASRVHEESSDIAKRVIEEIITEGRNFIFDAVLGNPNKAKALIKTLKDKGYNIKLVGVSVNAQNALERAKLRALGNGIDKSGSGRYVPDKILLEGHRGSCETFEKIKNLVDEVELYDNDVDLGKDPIKVMDNKNIYRKDLYDNFKNKANMQIKKSFLSRMRDIFSSSTKLIDLEGNELSDIDISRHKLRISKSYYDHLLIKLEELKQAFEQDAEDLAKAAEQNTSLQKGYQSHLDHLESIFLQDLIDNKQNINKALEDVKMAVIDHVNLIPTTSADFAYKKYLSTSLGRTRDTMPQIDSDKIDDVILHFAQKSPDAKVTKKTIKADQLRFAQGEINGDKVLKIMSDMPKATTRFLVSKDEDGYTLIDGHHRFCAMCEMEENPEIQTYVIHLPAKEALRRLNLMKLTRNEDISKADYSEKLNNLRKRRGELYYEISKTDKGFHPAILKDGEIQLTIRGSVETYEKALEWCLQTLNLSNFPDIQKSHSEKKYAASIVTNEQGQILFLRRHPDDDFHPNTLCLPSGSIEEGEDPQDAAVRELFEETSLESEHIHTLVEIYNGDACIYYNSVSTKEGQIVLDKEHSNYEWHSMDELKDNEELRSQLILDLYDHLCESLNMSQAIESYRVIEKAFNDNLITDDQFLTARSQFELIKAHKYIKREGTKGNYKYIYIENQQSNGSIKEEVNTERITNQEKEYLIDYTSQGYRKINKSLRINQKNEEVEKAEQFLNSALDKIKPFTGIVYRAEPAYDDIEKIFNFYKSSKVIQFNSFTSSTQDRSVLTNFGGQIKYEIKSKTGRNISNYSDRPIEREVLFKSKTKFKVNSVKLKKASNNYIIGLEIKLEEVA